MNYVALHWYDYYSQESNIDCKCSFCRVLVEEDEPEVRLWDNDKTKSLILNLACFVVLSQAGYFGLKGSYSDAH